MGGGTPLYYKHLSIVSPYEISANRVICSLMIQPIFIIFLKKGPLVWKVSSSITNLKYLLFTSFLISTNWFVFTWAIANGQLLDASLGYFINPILNVVLGVSFLKESLSRIKWTGVVLAVIGVAIQVVALGTLPWISLILGSSFASYALLRKK